MDKSRKRKKTMSLLAAIILAGAVMPVQALAQKADELKYYDVKECGFPLANQGFDGCVGYYGRLRAEMKDQVRDMVWYLAQNNAGITVRFRSDAKAIGVRWTLINDFRMNHMAPTGICGCDLYGYDDDGKWKYVGTAIPRARETKAVFRTNIDGKMREYAIFLPLYDGVSSIAVGIDSTAAIEKSEAAEGQNLFCGSATKPIVFFGHSGLQGGCASRPGMAYTNILSRRLKAECINLGFSGMGQMFTIMAREMNRIDASAYVLDCLGNNYLQMVRDSSEAFIKTLCEAHPQTPVIMLSSYPDVSQWVGEDTESETAPKNEFWRSCCEKLRKEGYRNVHYIDMRGPGRDRANPLKGSSACGDEEGTVDGGHLTDLGFQRIADFLEPYLKKVLK